MAFENMGLVAHMFLLSSNLRYMGPVAYSGSFVTLLSVAFVLFSPQSEV